MATYTNRNLDDAHKFASTNVKLRTLRKLYEKSPHLTSKLLVKMRPATHEDYYIPAVLSHAAFVVEVDTTKEFCESSSCNSMKEQGPCTPDEPASYYYVGDSAFDMQCQPACFNTNEFKRSAGADKVTQAQLLKWNEKGKKCRYLHEATMSKLEKPFYRSETKYEKRVNDMPTGFSRIENGDEFNSGFTYQLNPSYCRYFDRTLQENGECEYKNWEKFIDYTLGMAIVNTAKSKYSLVTEGRVFQLPENLPTLPKQIPREFTVDGWKSNINRNFKIPSLVDTRPRLPEKILRFSAPKSKDISETDYGGGSIGQGKKQRPNMEVDANNDEEIEEMKRSQVELNRELDTESMSTYMKECLGIATDKDKPDGIGQTEEELDKDPEKGRFEKVFEMLMKLANEHMLISAGIDVAYQSTNKHLKTLFLRIIERMSIIAGQEAPLIIGRLGENVFIKGMSSFIVKQAALSAVRVASQSAAFFARLSISALSVVGWILIIGQLTNIAFEFMDLYNYGSMIAKDAPKDQWSECERALREALKSSGIDYTFDQFTATILTEAEILEINITSIFDVLTYLDALVINSEGSRIEKGREIDLRSSERDGVLAAQNHAMASRVKFDPANFETYNEKFMKRVELSWYLNYSAGILLVTSGILFAVGFNILSFVLLMLCVVALAIARFSLISDTLVDATYKFSDTNRKHNQSGYVV